MVKYTVKQFKTILNIRKQPDSWFWEKYGLNLYNGCEHGCIYCDSRSAKYYLPTDFENDIVVKDNVETMLEAKIIKSRTMLADVVCMSGATDPYHAAENKYQNTRWALKVLQKYGFPVHILTKSMLVTRDLDIINEIAKQWACISFTITASEKETARFLEPKAPSPEMRFKAIANIKTKYPDIQSGILLMPVIPFISDASWQLEDLIKKGKDHGADYILFGSGMTMRDTQALWFMKHLKEKFPILLPKYEMLYRFKYDPKKYSGEYGVSNSYHQHVNETIVTLCEKYNMPIRIKRFIPEDFRRLNYLISEVLLNKAYMKSIESTYDKSMFWTGMNVQNLKESIVHIYQRNELHSIGNINPESETIIKKMIRDEHGETTFSKQLNLFD